MKAALVIALVCVIVGLILCRRQVEYVIKDQEQ
jgi:hypothetical protein